MKWFIRINCISILIALFVSPLPVSNSTVLAGTESQEEKVEKKPALEIFEMGDLEQQRADAKRPYLPFLKRSSLSMGVYFLPKDGKDGQQPHNLDEVYYVSSGKGILQVNGEDVPVKPGSVIFVEAHADHHFHSISEDITLLVFFSTAETDSKKD